MFQRTGRLTFVPNRALPRSAQIGIWHTPCITCRLKETEPVLKKAEEASWHRCQVHRLPERAVPAQQLIQDHAKRSPQIQGETSDEIPLHA